jgi:ATP-binding cassette subfamily B (MDR/TAP) protein 1
MQNVTRNIGEMVGNLTQLFKIQGAATAIAGIIYAPTSQTFVGSEKPMTASGENTTDEIQVEINSATFAYPTKKDIPVLHDISLKVPKNNIVALVGASGCGKSSIISLVERYYDPADGKFSYNGKNLNEVDNTWYH